jgi:two-component system sensor kinase FixL
MRSLFLYSEFNRTRILAAIGILIALIALLDWKIEYNYAFGFLYLFPMMLAGVVLARWQLVPLALLTAVLFETFGPFKWDQDGIPRTAMVTLAFLGTGLFSGELWRKRQLMAKHVVEIEHEVKLRQEAEEQLRVLIESSPAAIVTLGTGGEILLANRAAQQLLAFGSDPLTGEPIAKYLPALASVPRTRTNEQSFRTVMECRGRRRNGEVFLAYVWFSTYRTLSGPRLAAIILDGSEDLRDREELSLTRLNSSTRILMGAVAHEIRNLCAGIAVVHTNLAHVPGLAASPDFQALGTLVEALGKIAATELRPNAEELLAGVDACSVLEELRIIAEPSIRETEATLTWDVPPALPPVWGEYHALLQVFLNLTKNSLRAMETSAEKRLTIAATEENGQVIVRFRDTGPGVSAPERLFQPFQRGAESPGLGLYVSRAIVRAFEGEVRYEPQPAGSCFAVELSSAASRGRKLRPAAKAQPATHRQPATEAHPAGGSAAAAQPQPAPEPPAAAAPRAAAEPLKFSAVKGSSQ